MLNLAQYEELPSLDLVPPAKHRSPLLALALSALFPGLGQLYIGLHRNAAWIIGFEFYCIATIYAGSGTLHAQSIFVAPILYCYAVADAYFAAREYNAGVDSLLIGTNPRIAALLNLVTKGFGYFYLGDRAKGVICFVVCSAVQAALLLRLNVWTSILALSLQAAIGLDGYRVARQRLLADHPGLIPRADPADDLIARANPGGLPPAITTFFFLALGTFFLIGYATLRAITGHFITTQGALENGPNGLTYRNAVEHVSITAPDAWTSDRTQNSLVMLRGDGASVILLDQYSINAIGSTLEADRKSLVGRHPEASITYPGTIVAQRPAQAFEATYTNNSGATIHQRIAYVRRGIRIFVLVESWITEDKRPLLDQIEQSVTI